MEILTIFESGPIGLKFAPLESSFNLLTLSTSSDRLSQQTNANNERNKTYSMSIKTHHEMHTIKKKPHTHVYFRARETERKRFGNHCQYTLELSTATDSKLFKSVAQPTRPTREKMKQ